MPRALWKLEPWTSGDSFDVRFRLGPPSGPRAARSHCRSRAWPVQRRALRFIDHLALHVTIAVKLNMMIANTTHAASPFMTFSSMSTPSKIV
jgi:hypothetical protein